MGKEFKNEEISCNGALPGGDYGDRFVQLNHGDFKEEQKR